MNANSGYRESQRIDSIPSTATSSTNLSNCRVSESDAASPRILNSSSSENHGRGAVVGRGTEGECRGVEWAIVVDGMINLGGLLSRYVGCNQSYLKF